MHLLVSKVVSVSHNSCWVLSDMISCISCIKTIPNTKPKQREKSIASQDILSGKVLTEEDLT